MRKLIQKWLRKKAAEYLQRDAKGLVYSKGPTVADPAWFYGGWIFGTDWYIAVAPHRVNNAGVGSPAPK